MDHDVSPPCKPRFATAVPTRAGVGLKGQHADDVLATPGRVAWFEIHPENYMVDGGPRLAFLEQVRAAHPISVHGVAMSLGGAAPPDMVHLARVKTLVDRFDPGLISEHIAWSDHGGTYFADLLPVSLTRAALDLLVRNIDIVQSALGRRILIENPSNYLVLPGAEMSETVFIAEAIRRSGCGLLIDVNNVFVSAHNLGTDP